MTTTRPASRRTRKIAALAAGVLVIGVGATYTLASWTDSEWVWGGLDGDPGVGTSTFEVEQNVTSTFDNDEANWQNHETNPGDELTFTTGALSLTPGDTIYAPVALRTDTPSVPAEVTLQGAVAADAITVDDTSDLLWNAIEVSVFTQNTTAADFAPSDECGADVASSGDWTQIVTDAPFATVASGPQSLAADSASVQHYCFTLTLPAGADDDLQGRTIAPTWEFASVSQ